MPIAILGLSLMVMNAIGILTVGSLRASVVTMWARLLCGMTLLIMVSAVGHGGRGDKAAMCLGAACVAVALADYVIVTLAALGRDAKPFR